MEEKKPLTGWKKALAALGKTVAVLVIYGGILFVFILFGMLGAFPLYVTYGLGLTGIVLMAAVILQISGYLGPRVKKGMWTCVLLVAAGSCVYMGTGVYEDSLASLEDAERNRMLWKYEPFSEEMLEFLPPQDASLKLTKAEAWGLKLDGATALYPVYAGFVQSIYPEGEYRRYDSTNADGLGNVTCSGTNDAYERLLAGDTDIVFAAGPSDAQLARAEEMGMKLYLTAIGREAFVFFVNEANPVTGLTVEQIQGIYSGEIKNWAEVGGRRRSIRAFQRAEDSGSQTALQRLMGDIPIMEPDKEDRIAGMGGIIRQVASYRNYKNALGFSFRFYCTEMVENGEIRLLALNGTEPTKDTIRDGSYPVSNSFYAVTAAPAGQPAPQETDDTIGAFLNWILSEEGQQIVEACGYVGIR